MDYLPSNGKPLAQVLFSRFLIATPPAGPGSSVLQSLADVRLHPSEFDHCLRIASSEVLGHRVPVKESLGGDRRKYPAGAWPRSRPRRSPRTSRTGPASKA